LKILRFRSMLLPLVSLVAYSQVEAPRRPPITGISHVAFHAATPEATKKFYADTLGLTPGSRAGLFIIGTQELETKSEKESTDYYLLAHVAFSTSDAEGMRLFLKAHGIDVPSSVHNEANGTKWFPVKDPEGIPIEFVEKTAPKPPEGNPSSSQIIHAGFVVHDRAREDKFYRDLLGFRLYWHGGPVEGQDDWVAMQVPDGRQWIEYMLAKPDVELTPHQLGVMNHVALGVADIHDTEKYLSARGWTPTDQSKVQMGRDGKYQLNIYDPDGTRVEFMEFTPKGKTCCNEFTGPHPEAK
jgi:catechol 2,3-dioxygenase-like lactoylglutathione lyase family enzyme